MNVEDQRAAMDRLYARLPRLQCKGLCQQFCGQVPMSEVEHRRIVEYMGEPIPFGRTIVCPLLDRDSGKCTCYPVRPLICRGFGLVDDPLLRCPHGCKPSRWLSNKEFGQFVAKMGEIVERGKTTGPG